MSWMTSLVMAVALAGCGSKTGLEVPRNREDASIDAGVVVVDAFVEPDSAVPLECIELPFEEEAREVLVSFVGRIQSADVMFLVDTTGSMGEEIDQIQAGLVSTIIPGIAAEIPDVRFSVGIHADFPELSFGSEGDIVFQLLQGSTPDLTAAQNAVNRIPNLNGADGPESQVEGLYQTATGEGLGPYVPPARCPSGTVGYPCFRAEGSRIILLFTDAEFHNGPGGAQPYSGITPAPHRYDETVNALRRIGAKVLGLYSGSSGGGDAGFAHLQSIARDTGAVGSDGAPIVFDIGSTGNMLGRGVIDTVQTLVDEVPLDIDLLTEDVASDDFDATRLVSGIEALRSEPPDGAVNLGDRFADVRPGTRVFFRVLLRNDVLPPAEEARVFLLKVVLRGDGVVRLQETIVQIVIPGIRMETCDDLDLGIER